MAGVQKRREWRFTGETVGFSIAKKIAPGLLNQLSGLAGVVGALTGSLRPACRDGGSR